MRKPQLNPSAETFVPSFGSDLASWAQKLQVPKPQAPNGMVADTSARTVMNGRREGTDKVVSKPSSMGVWGKGGPLPGSTASNSQCQAEGGAHRNCNGFSSPSGRDPADSSRPREGLGSRPAGNASAGLPRRQKYADSCYSSSSSRVNARVSAEPRGSAAKGPGPNSLGPSPPGLVPCKAWSSRSLHGRQKSGAVATQPLSVAADSSVLRAGLASEQAQESWVASATRRAIGSDSGDLEFDDLFDGGAGTDSRATTPSSVGGSGRGRGALEHSLSNQTSVPACAAAAELASAVSLEAALARGGMHTTSHVDQPSSSVGLSVLSLADGAPSAEAATLPPASLSLSVSLPAAGSASVAASPQADVVPATPQAQVRTCDVPMSPSKVSPADFQVLKVVGQGAFGKVFQVRKRDTGRVYAMKVMRKDKILARDHGEYVRAERDVLTSVRHPYIVMLNWSFQTSTKLYLVLDFVNGGHLFFNLYRAGIFDEAQACLYTAEIVAAIAHLHSLHIVHRDLKPENVLLDGEGHVRVTDFGLAKSVPEGSRSNSLIGTMEYMAPEIISGSGHNKSVDWWSIGVLLFEMVCGITPFRSKDKNSLKRMITQQKLKFTKSADGYLSQPAKALMRALLEKDPAKRLGGGAGGSEAVKKHPFFRTINWAALEQRQVPSPYCPKTSGFDCVDNFDKLWTDRTPEDSPVGSPTTTPFGNSFRGFTYIAPSFLSSPRGGSLAS